MHNFITVSHTACVHRGFRNSGFAVPRPLEEGYWLTRRNTPIPHVLLYIIWLLIEFVGVSRVPKIWDTLLPPLWVGARLALETHPFPISVTVPNSYFMVQ